MRRIVLVSVILASLVTLAAPASAAEPRVHDGLHFRAALGLGYAGDSFESDPILGERLDGSLGGLALVGELSAGYAVFPGGFVGGGFFLNHLPSPEGKDVDWGDATIDEVELEAGTYWMLGPLLDLYPKPESGLHVAVSLGYGRLSLGDGEAEVDTALGVARYDIQDQHADGFSAMIGVGYDFWVHDVASIGVVGRFMAAPLRGEDDDDVDWKHTVYAPALLLSASFD